MLSKNKKKTILIEFNQITSDEFLSLFITNFDTKHLSNIRLRVYKSILPKILTLSFDLEITSIGASKFPRLDFDYENRFC